MDTNPNPNPKTDTKEQLTIYLNSLTKIEKKALEIAQTQLESSFDLEKSTGFQEFLKSQTK
jgi:hypothetical protein